MNCPHCGHRHHIVLDTRRLPKEKALRRTRICNSCHKKFGTNERVEEWDSTIAEYVEHEPEPEEKVVPIKKASKAPRIETFQAEVDEPLMHAITDEARPLLVEWWNVSRRSKHKDKAAWTKSAWEGSLRRVSLLPAHKQVLLARAGVEHGWQALKVDYLRDELNAPTGAGRPMPKDPAMLAALDEWPGID